jgi:hypothetical protein
VLRNSEPLKTSVIGDDWFAVDLSFKPIISLRAFSSEVETGSRQENASNQESGAPLRFHRSGKGSGGDQQ